MRVDLRTPDSWHKVNGSYREALGLGAGSYAVQAYMGVAHALWEIGTQLAQLQPNKRTIVYLKEAAAVFEPLAVHLSREGFKVRALTEAELNSPGEWLDAVVKDLLIVLTACDEPVTGELFETPVLEASLKDKRVYRVRVSHSQHACVAPSVPQPLEAHILSVAPDRAVALMGERVKVGPPIASGLAWTEIDTKTALIHLSQDSTHRFASDWKNLTAKVEAFEANAPLGAEPIVACGRARLPDRVLIAYRDLDGLALAEELARLLQIALPPAGQPGLIETTSLCRWKDERTLQGLLARGFAPELLRGLLILDVTLLDRADLRPALEAARERVLALQNGE